MARITAQNYQSYMKGSGRHIDTHTREMYLGDSPTVQAGYGTYDSKDTAHKVACYMFSLNDSATESTPCEDIPRGFTVAIEENNTVVEYQYKKPMPSDGYTAADLEVKSIANVDASDVSYGNSNVGTALLGIEEDIQNLEGDVGTVSSLETAYKQDLVGAVNEVNTKANSANTKIGTLTSLHTTDKTTVVDAINEVKDAIPTSMSAENVTYNSSDSHTAGSIAEAVATETTRAQAAEADRYTKSETYTKEEVHNLITTPNQEYVSVTATALTTAITDVLPVTGATDTTYRVGNWDGTQYNDSVFSEYAWNGNAYIKLSTKSQIGEVYDISANHANTKYANLTAALGTNGDNVPSTIRKGGMSVKFINSTTNKYEQWNLKTSSWSVNTSDWALDVDSSVTNGRLKLSFELEKPSSNEYVTQASQIGYLGSPVNEKLDPLIYGCYLNSSISASTGLIEPSSGEVSTDFIPCTAGANAKLYNNGTKYNVRARYYNANKAYIGYESSVDNKAYVRLIATISESALNSVDENIYVVLNGTTIYLNPSVVSNNNIIRLDIALSNQATNLEQTNAKLSRESATTKTIAINIDGKYVNKNTGAIDSVSGFSISERIYVKSGDAILYTGTVYGSACEVCLYYDNTFEVQTVTNGRCTIAHDGYIVACSTTSSNGTVCIYNSRIDLTSINQSIDALQGEVTQLSALVNIVDINVDGYYIYAANGRVQALSGWSVSNRIGVKTGDIVVYNGLVQGNAAAICLYYNDTFEIPTITDGKCTISHDGYIIACSKNGNNGYVYIYNDRVDGSSDAAKSSQTYINAEKVTKIDIITSGVENKYIKIDTGAITAWKPSWGASYYATEDYIPVNVGDEWLFEGYAAGNAVAVAFYNKNKTYVSGASVQTSVYGTYRFVIPSGAVYMRVSSNIQYITKPCVFRRTKFELDNKKWIVIGDSISTAYTSVQRHFYYDVIARAYKNCTTSVFAVAGSRMAYNTGSTISFVQRVETMIEEDTNKDANIITVFGGVNDWGQEKTSTADSPIPLGTINDALPADYTEATTFYKALKYLCSILIQNYPNAKIMFITPIGANPDSGVTSFANGTNSLGLTIMDYRNAMKDVCQTYGIKVIDVGGCSGITPIVASQKAAFFLTYAQDSLGGLHPNPDGHVKIAECVERDLI